MLQFSLKISILGCRDIAAADPRVRPYRKSPGSGG